MYRSTPALLVILLTVLVGCGDQPLVIPTDLVSSTDTQTDASSATDQGPILELPQAECTTAADCPDVGICSDAVCIEGQCTYPNKEGACDDGDLCTSDDHCTGGLCIGSPMACDDGNQCTTDSCSEGNCTGTPLETAECALDIILEYPPRAATLDDDPNILVQGRVISPAGAIKSIRINGAEKTVAPDGTFNLPMESYVGMNPIEVRVEDVFDRTIKHSQAYLYASTLVTPGVPSAIIQIDGASNVWLGRATFDDEAPADLDDVAALGKEIMESFDANTMLPHPIPECLSELDLADESEICLEENPSFSWCSWTVDISDVQYDVKSVHIYPVPDGLQLSAELDDFEASHGLTAGGACPDCLGTLDIDTVSIEGTIPIQITPQKDIDVSVVGLEVEISGLDVTCEEGFGSWFNWIINWFEGTIEGTFETLLSEFIPNNLVPMVQGVLNQVLDYDIVFELPSFTEGGPGTTMHLKVSPEEFEINSLGTEWRLNIGAASPATIQNISAGTIARNDCDGLEPKNGFWLPRSSNVEASLHEDFLNQLLYIIWQTGHINFTVGDEALSDENPLKISNLDLQVEPLLPPVLTSCGPGFKPELQIGDVHGTGSMRILANDVTIEFYASTRIQISPKVETLADGSSSIGFDKPEVSYFSLQIVSLSGLGETTTESLEPFFSDLIVDYIGDGLLGSLIDSYPLPVVDVSTWIPSLPAGSEVTFEASTAEAIKGHTVITGSAKEP